MNNNRLVAVIVATLLVALAMPGFVVAGAKIKIDEDSSIDLGFRLQTLYLNNDQAFRPNDENDFRVRRGRIRLGADVTDYFSLFLQSDVSGDSGGGFDVRLIDAFINLHPHPWFQIVAGENMAPSNREALTSSAALLTADRPGLQNKVLTWSSQFNGAFNTGALPGTDAGLGGEVDVRDLGVTLFGSSDFSNLVHGKYYLGVYEGSDTNDDTNRFTGRVQINLLDPEPNYYNLSTYLGKKRTIGIGASYDTQDEVAVDSVTGDQVDYEFYTFDGFLEYPVGPGSLTTEVAWEDMNLNNATDFLTDQDGAPLLGGDPEDLFPADQSSGNGWYVQAGYFIPTGPKRQGFQPWALYEQFDSDASANDDGSLNSFRLGMTYFLKGFNANIKAGYERTSLDGGPNVDTFLVGLYTTY